MGTFKVFYDYAQRKAHLELRGAMYTFGWLQTLPENENLIVINAADLAKTLGLTVGTVYTHLRKIQEVGLMQADMRTSGVYRLCPFNSWRGTAQAMANYIAKLPDNHKFFKFMDPEFKQALQEEAALINNEF